MRPLVYNVSDITTTPRRLLINILFLFLSSVERTEQEKVKKKDGSPPYFLSKDTQRIEILKINRIHLDE